jgi:hypothetical protein
MKTFKAITSSSRKICTGAHRIDENSERGLSGAHGHENRRAPVAIATEKREYAAQASSGRRNFILFSKAQVRMRVGDETLTVDQNTEECWWLRPVALQAF